MSKDLHYSVDPDLISKLSIKKKPELIPFVNGDVVGSFMEGDENVPDLDEG